MKFFVALLRLIAIALALITLVGLVVFVAPTGNWQGMKLRIWLVFFLAAGLAISSQLYSSSNNKNEMYGLAGLVGTGLIILIAASIALPDGIDHQ